jgi:hypothetical protein
MEVHLIRVGQPPGTASEHPSEPIQGIRATGARFAYKDNVAVRADAAIPESPKMPVVDSDNAHVHWSQPHPAPCVEVCHLGIDFQAP